MEETYSVSNLATRYGMDEAAFVACAKSHQEEINYDDTHMVSRRGVWTFDQEAVVTLDKLLHYQEKVEESTDDLNETVTQLKSENDELKDKVGELANRLQMAGQQNAEATQQMQILQDQLIKLQNGRDKANSIALQNQANRADQAEKKAARLQEKLDSVSRTKAQEVHELEKQNADLQKKLSEYNKTLQERLKADFEVLNVKKNEDKLYQELRTHKGTITELKQEIAELEDKRDNIVAELSNLKGAVMTSVTALQNVTSELTQAAKVEIVSPAKDESRLRARKRKLHSRRKKSRKMKRRSARPSRLNLLVSKKPSEPICARNSVRNSICVKKMSPLPRKKGSSSASLHSSDCSVRQRLLRCLFSKPYEKRETHHVT